MGYGSNLLSYMDVGTSISNKYDYQHWREFYAPESVRSRDRRFAEGSQHGHRPPRRKKVNFHYFKRASEKKFKFKKEDPEEDDLQTKPQASPMVGRIVVKAET